MKDRDNSIHFKHCTIKLRAPGNSQVIAFTQLFKMDGNALDWGFEIMRDVGRHLTQAFNSLFLGTGHLVDLDSNTSKIV